MIIIAWLYITYIHMYVLTYMFCQQFSTQFVIENVFLCNHNFAIFYKENTFVEEKKNKQTNNKKSPLKSTNKPVFHWFN